MKIVYLDKQTELLSSGVATIGFFDGVHLGHRYLIDKVCEIARGKGMLSTVITFASHPRQVLQPSWHPQLLSTFEEKMALLSQTGIDQVVVLRFDEAMAALSAHDFMFDILCKQLGVKVLLAGYDNHFGHRSSDSQEGFADYVKYGEEMGISVVQGAPFVAGDVRVSSSKVRGFLHEGNVEQAAQCLGHPYELTGKVVSGEHIGTSMGYPTANLQPTDANKLIPAPGVYAVKVRMKESLEVRHGMMNIGCRPTFNGDHQTLETHIFHFSHDIYGKEMTVWFISRLREETRFSSQEALKVQLEADAHQAETILRKTDEI